MTRKTRMQYSRFLAAIFALVAAVPLSSKIATADPANILHSKNDFDAGSMTRPSAGQGNGASSFSLAQPGRFSMQQSYSLSAMSGSYGSMSSGLYLNTLSYRLAPPLVLSADIGFHTPIHSSIPGAVPNGSPGSVILPRMGLEYRPTENLLLNIELFNGPDAWKAYGGAPWSPAFHGNRVP